MCVCTCMRVCVYVWSNSYLLDNRENKQAFLQLTFERKEAWMAVQMSLGTVLQSLESANGHRESLTLVWTTPNSGRVLFWERGNSRGKAIPFMYGRGFSKDESVALHTEVQWRWCSYSKTDLRTELKTKVSHKRTCCEGFDFLPLFPLNYENCYY